MGHTNYFSNVYLTPAVAEDARKIVQAATDTGVSLAGPLGTGAPEISDERIAFNGDAERDEDYESFILPAAGAGHSFPFVKTARKPYDASVVAVLISAWVHTGVGFDSDERFDSVEIQAGKNLFERAVRPLTNDETATLTDLLG